LDLISNEVDALPFVFNRTPPDWLACASVPSPESDNLLLFQISNIMIFCAALWVFIRRKNK
jgi:hypothetical protein